ncbi:beta-galactosidase [Abditibacteriota bacterium]|nr:beta-galactosidase [Abditibacteriota bacterium]
MKKNIILLTLASLGVLSGVASANDDIFPPLPGAKAAIDFDGRGFLVNGKRTFIASGTIHYPRVPRALWHDRLLKLKRAGFNTVETYAFWNYHEPKEGQFDFSGEKDFGAFLQAAQDVGLYAIVRVGPYICGEWDSGGYPNWLRFKPDVRVREDNPAFVAATMSWYDHILAIVAGHQIQRGGNVLMVQLENEHPRGWGTDMPTPYFNKLLDKARTMGIEVPTFFSGLHHGSDPAPRDPFSSQGRKNPWFTTEFWPGWYDLYGPLQETGGRSVRQFERGTWRILSTGGNGYNFYMLHGGSNFDHWNNNEDAAAYDYGGAIGQAGDLRPIYYRFKRANLFATSFGAILEDSDNASADFQNAASNVKISARKGPSGTIVFLDNPTESVVSAQLNVGFSMQLERGETLGLVRDFALDGTFKIADSAARILGFARQGNLTTVVIYGGVGQGGRMKFSVSGTQKATANSTAWTGTGNGQDWTLNAPFPASGVIEQTLTAGKNKLRVLVMNTDAADKTWFVDTKNGTSVISGASYIGDVTVNGNRVSLTSEEPWTANKATPQIAVYSPSGTTASLKVTTSATTGGVPTVGNWQSFRGDAPAQTKFSDASWKSSPAPLPMSADGDNSAYAWYRTTLRAPVAGDYNLNFSDVGDTIAIFVNGKPVGKSAVQRRFDKPVRARFKVMLPAGESTLAVFASTLGRDKLFNYIGPLNSIDLKGVCGSVTLTPVTTGADSIAPVTGWRWRSSVGGDAEATQQTAADVNIQSPEWKDAQIGQDIFSKQKGFAWFRATLGNVAGPHRILKFESIDDKATIYLNGQKVGRQEQYGEEFEVPVDAAWKEEGPNILAVMIENTDGVGGIMGEVELQTAVDATNPALMVQGWKLRGGPNEPTATASWQPITTNALGVPMWYRASFVALPTTASGPVPVVRFSTKGLSRGFVYLNGHNLGRYPEKTPADGIYLPEAWIQKGNNTLMIFDEEGAIPQSNLIQETAASRQRYQGVSAP